MRPERGGDRSTNRDTTGSPAASPLTQPQRRVEVEGVRGIQPVVPHWVRDPDWHSIPLSANGEASTHPWGVQGKVRKGCVGPAQPSLRGRPQGAPPRAAQFRLHGRSRAPAVRIGVGQGSAVGAHCLGRMGGCVAVWPCPSAGVDYRRTARAGGPPSKRTYRTHCPGNPGLVESLAALQQRGAAQDRGGSRSAGTRRPLDQNRSPGGGTRGPLRVQGERVARPTPGPTYTRRPQTGAALGLERFRI
jgi:hypothetical protein